MRLEDIEPLEPTLDLNPSGPSHGMVEIVLNRATQSQLENLRYVLQRYPGTYDVRIQINPPETGIIAVGRMVEQPVVHQGAVVVRRRMRLTMSCDHRVIDGATGARFLQTLKGMLENPLAMVY